MFNLCLDVKEMYFGGGIFIWSWVHAVSFAHILTTVWQPFYCHLWTIISHSPQLYIFEWYPSDGSLNCMTVCMDASYHSRQAVIRLCVIRKGLRAVIVNLHSLYDQKSVLPSNLIHIPNIKHAMLQWMASCIPGDKSRCKRIPFISYTSMSMRSNQHVL